jgi:GNAT superfamily N-acetyltransferase
MQPHLVTVSTTLPDDVDILQRAAAAEGIPLVARMISEWHSGVQRFSGAAECLLVARVGGHLAGVGGLTRDPVVPAALRMRRFYVLPRYRRLGLAKMLVEALLAQAPQDISIGVNVGPAAAVPFWEAVGFVAVHRDGITHQYQR